MLTLKFKIQALLILAFAVTAASVTGDWGILLLVVSSWGWGGFMGMELLETLLAAANARTEHAWISADRAQDGWQEANETNGRVLASYMTTVYAFRNHLLGHLSYDEAVRFVEAQIGDIHREPGLPN